jgi:hypothetical protein
MTEAQGNHDWCDIKDQKPLHMQQERRRCKYDGTCFKEFLPRTKSLLQSDRRCHGTGDYLGCAESMHGAN